MAYFIETGKNSEQSSPNTTSESEAGSWASAAPLEHPVDEAPNMGVHFL